MIGAVDIGGTKIAVGMVSGSGKVLAKIESPTDAHLGDSYRTGPDVTVALHKTLRSNFGKQHSTVGDAATASFSIATGTSKMRSRS